MRDRVVAVVLSGLIGWLGGAAGLALLAIANSPAWFLSHPLEAIEGGAVGSLTYVLAPVLIMSCAALAAPARISTGITAAIGVAWLALIFAGWARGSMAHGGDFPWWGFERYFLSVLPVPFCCALAFALSFRRMRRGPPPSGASGR
ncbi:MAG TPA: hypothetical protein VLV56_14535 [Burkholderiales bacterium]|nr:hypothetical protein [Burkholderiales bacterium]